MQNVTIGGERLGSGKKMKVGLHGFERSTHDLGYVWRSTMSAGTLVPFMSEIALPGDTFDIDLSCDVMTAPTIGPLFGSYKVQLDVFQIPMRLYNSLLHNNMLGIGNEMQNVKLPTLELSCDANSTSKDIDNSQINPSCILNYLGIRGIGRTANYTTRKFNGVSLLAYWDIYKNYYSAKQEKQGAIISAIVTFNGTVTTVTVTNPSITVAQDPALSAMNDLEIGSVIRINYSGTPPDASTVMFQLAGRNLMSFTELVVAVVDYGTYLEGIYNFSLNGLTYIENWRYLNSQNSTAIKPRVQFFPLTNIDDMRKAILAFSSLSTPFSINGQNYLPYNSTFGTTGGGSYYSYAFSQNGLGIKTYQSDLLNNWLDTTWVGSINSASAVSTLAGNFTMDQLNFSKKVYEMLNRIAISGGSYNDWLDAVYDHERSRIPESPIYVGGLIKELVFQEVVSTSATDGEALGTLAGRGKLSGKNKGGKVVIKVDEPSYIMGIVSLTPRIDYSQGNRWDVGLQTLNDLHKPNLDEIGFQDLITEQMAFWDTTWNGSTWVKKSAGKQPAWLNYMTNYNRTFGNFAINGNQMFMTLNRRYEYDQSFGIKDLTSYIDPAKYNNIFASTQIDAQNFWCQIGVDITARRKMSAKIMPNL
jgi:hypothetical protein